MSKSKYEFQGSDLEKWLMEFLDEKGNIEDSSSDINSFLNELYKKVSDDLDMISLPKDGQAVLYAGWHSDVAMWQLVDSITGQTDNYYYISDTPAGMLMGDERFVFQDLLSDIIGKEYVDKLFNSNTKEFSDEALEGIVNFNDYVSQNVAEKYVGNDGNALIFVSDYNPESVLIRTELPTLLEKKSVKTINGIPKESLIAYCEMFADVDNELAGYQKVVEVLSNVSENYLADTKILVITDAQKTELITQYGEDAVNKILSKMNIIVDTSEWADGTDVSVNGIGNNADIYKAIKEFTSVNNKNSGVKNTAGLNSFIEFEELRTYSTNSAGELVYDVTKTPQGYTAKEWFDLVSKSDAMVMTEAELSVKYSFLEVASQSDMDTFRAYEYYVSRGALSENIVSNGIMSEVELKSKYSFLTECTNTDLNAYRGYEYLKSTGASDDIIRTTGLLPDADLKAMHSFLAEGSEADLNAYRNCEYLKSVGASDDLIRATGLLPDADIKFKYEFLSDCTDTDVLNRFRNYEYISANNIAKTTADSLSGVNIYLNSDGKLVQLSDVVLSDMPENSVYQLTMKDAKNFLVDGAMESVYKGF